MKIKRKPLKPSKSSRPAFLVGWSFGLPTTPDLKNWFDLEYGGPLKIAAESNATNSGSRFTLSHALWSTSLICPLPAEEAAHWREHLHWGHQQAAAILHRAVPPAQAPDMQVFVSRLARGLTLLSEGTSYDVQTGAFFNPSDWTDRPLTSFLLDDHITVTQQDTEDPTAEWFRTMGLSKFGLDELETSRPRGLAAQPTIDRLLHLAGEILRAGQNPKVGATLDSPLLDARVEVVAHRTVPHTTGPLAVRQVRW